MSSKSQSIEIKPPRNGEMVEGIYSSGHVCPYCKGNGWPWGEYRPGAGVEKAYCSKCKGSGMLDAMVTIEWKPSAMRE
jgi:DnaJ-class molecular chaperone